MLELRIRLFGGFRKYMDGRELRVSVSPGIRVAELRPKIIETLRLKHPGFVEDQLVLDSALADETRVLPEEHSIDRDGVFAILPPVCGG